MVRVSNTIVGFLYNISLLLCLVAICTSLYFFVHEGTQCQKFLNALIIVGAFIFAVSLLGLIGSCCRINFVIICLMLMFLLIVGLTVGTVYGKRLTNEGMGDVVSGIGHKEHRLGDYSNWLGNHFVNGKNWVQIKNCLSDFRICKILTGCCQPPSVCEFESKNGTIWVAPKAGPASKGSDCTTWSNQQETICFYCNACKVGFLEY
ncbi:LOW QUALITY PROTEIN: Tetraspannin domain-containing protein [Cephalotus follicularis]|uniref:Tetraspannin domain-containing protein n=1 Tax=Cephalotus follicularis TaxID=3775 RepID=A0A1Q3B717_CEPFO|nr:LOW QUALITY PROTEIN: Tetraspannin domain-containing protein [Cephalotus follicularis]